MPSLVQKGDVVQPECSSYPYNDNEKPAAHVVPKETYEQGPVLSGNFVPSHEVIGPIATLPANTGAVANIHREFDAQSVYPGDACLFVAK